jgi:aminopeptidase N
MVSLVLAVPLVSALLAAGVGDEIPFRWGRDRLVDLEHVRLELTVDLEAQAIAGNAQLTVVGLANGTTDLEIDARELDVARVTCDGRDARFDHDGSTLHVVLAEAVDLGGRRVLRVDYSARPRNGLHFVGPDAAYPEKQLQCWSQGESEENRYWFPVHDYPNERATSETLITVKKPASVVANGALDGVHDNGDGTRTYHHRLDFPHVPYLTSIAVADWATTTGRWSGGEWSTHVPRAQAHLAERTFASTPRILEILGRLTGVAYPYPAYRQTCVTDFMWGGMENISATTLTAETLHDERAHLDFRSEGLLAHEAAHQWFGDYVTCADWSDIWLNEGFATYYETLVMRELEGEDQFVAGLDGLQASAIDADAGPKRRPIVTHRYHDEPDLFDGHAYAKGACVLHALRREIGDDAYARSVTTFLREHAGQSVHTSDLVDVIERTTGRDVSRFFGQWVHGSGQPELRARWSWRDGRVTLVISQVQGGDDAAQVFEAWVDVMLLGDGPEHVEAVRLSGREESFQFPSAARPRAVLVDPEGWLLKKLDMERGSGELTHALAHAPLARARMDAARGLAPEAGVPAATRALVAALRDDASWPVRREAAKALGKARGPEAMAALLSALSADPESRVRVECAAALGGFRDQHAVVAALARALQADPSYATAAAAARALGKLEAPGAAATLERALGMRSHREVVFAGALDGLYDLKAPRLRQTCETWSAYGKPVRARNAALAMLAKLGWESGDVELRKSVRERLTRLLDDPLFWTRNTACEGLATLGDGAALADLERVAASAPEGRLARTARQSVEKLRERMAQSAKVEDLARKLEEEAKARRELEDKLRKLDERLGKVEDDDEEGD